MAGLMVASTPELEKCLTVQKLCMSFIQNKTPAHLPGDEQSQQALFPGRHFISSIMALVSSSILFSPLPWPLLKATFRASSLLLLRTEIQLHKGGN